MTNETALEWASTKNQSCSNEGYNDIARMPPVCAPVNMISGMTENLEEDEADDKKAGILYLRERCTRAVRIHSSYFDKICT